ncbi:hypothetical protein B9Q01_06260 [Candidatus Marsarchaeota G1 archaeon OSP_D]|jgi:hypothetical protein|nr:MAG: hypothetical protein B9Q01_06260 [Candidatus Marsarchaeota G1 archaeon OSP_D]PSN87802.1 MAG: hypothetical protein B9Q00_07705 [Candidatus Marsarchaeota G1 archaeon OSP_C]
MCGNNFERRFSKLFEACVKETFEIFGVAGSVLIKESERLIGLSLEEWWKNPFKMKEAFLTTFGFSGKHLIRLILENLEKRLDPSDPAHKEFLKVVNELRELL